MKLIIPDTNSKEFRALLTSGDGDEGVLTLRGHITPERMTQVALAAIRRRPELLQCRVESLLEALTLCMEAGLEPDGRSAHLLAQADAVRVVFDWKGLVALGRRCGAGAIHADVVCEQDEFGVSYDGGTRLTHKVDYKKPRGEAYAAYCYYILKGEPAVEVMTLEEIERVHTAEIMAEDDGSPFAGLWEEDWEGMAKRVVITRASVHWPLDDAAATVFAPSTFSAGEGPSAGVGLGSDGVPPPCGAGAAGGAPPRHHPVPDEPPRAGRYPKAKPLEALRHFMEARGISDESMLDYLKEEGRIADFVTRLADVPEEVIESVVTSWVEMMEEEGGI